MTTPDPDPDLTPGLDRHRTMPDGDTPPAEGGTHGISHPEPPELRHAWGRWPVVVIVLLALMVAVMLIGMVVALSS